MDIKTENLSLEIVYKRMKNGSLNPSPEFQRTYIWREPMKSELILSIIEKYPIGNIILYQKPNPDPDNIIDSEFIWETVDGQQRLLTIKEFIENKLLLHPRMSYKVVKLFEEDFRRLADSNDKKRAAPFKKLLRKYERGGNFKIFYDNLPPKLQQRILTYPMQLTYIIDADESMVREYFRRVQNQEKLKAGEIINALPPSYITDLVRDVTDYDLLESVFGYKDKRYNFMKFCVNIIGIYEGELKLGDSDKKILKFAETDKSRLSSSADNAINNISNFLKKVIEREAKVKVKYNNTDMKLFLLFVSEYGPTVINEYGVEKVILTLERIFKKSPVFKSRKVHELLPQVFDGYPNEIIEKYREVSNLTYQTHNLGEIRKTIATLYEIVDHEISKEKEQSQNDFNRSVSEQQKRVLLEKAGWKCQICGKSLTLAEAHVDHIIPFSKGGKTSPENLQILCEECNKKKSNKIITTN